jgi:hypothetical protein
MLSRAKKIALAVKAKITQFKDFILSPKVYTQQIFKKLAVFSRPLPCKAVIKDEMQYFNIKIILILSNNYFSIVNTRCVNWIASLSKTQ